MLLIATKMYELNFSQLMEVYYGSNQENGAYFFPEESPGRALILAEQKFREYLQEDFFAHIGAAYYIWQEDGQYVSALRLEPYEGGVLLQALETKPDSRAMGYAGKLIRETLRTLPGGTKVYSHVSKRNAASLAVHCACGFRQMLDYAVEIDGTVTRKCVTLLCVCGSEDMP